MALHGATRPWVTPATELWEELAGASQATVWGRGSRLPLPTAVLANSHAMNAFEFDDTYVWGGLGTHHGNNVIPAAVAVAEWRGGVTGKEFLVALAAGHEIGVRIMLGITRKRRGYNQTAISSTFGAAAAAGRLLGLDAQQMTWALGCAGAYVGGLLTMPPHSMVKRMVNGRAAEGGVLGALLARRRFTGIENVLEAGQGGFYTTHTDGFDAQRVIDGLGQTFHAVHLHTKRYPLVTSAHAAVEATCRLTAGRRFSPQEIDAIVVRTTSGAQTNTVGFVPRTVSSAQMSLAFAVATALTTGGVLPETISEQALDDRDLQRLITLVQPVKDPVLDDMWRGRAGSGGPASVDLRLKDGRVVSSGIVPEASRMTDEEIEAKAHHLVTLVFGADRAERLVRFFRHFDGETAVDGLMPLLRP